MKPEVLIAWIETEGCFCLDIPEKRPTNPRLTIKIDQKNLEVINRIYRELGYGEAGGKNQSGVFNIRFRRVGTLDKLFKFIDTVPETEWYHPVKLEQYKKSKEFFYWQTNHSGLWNDEDMVYVLSLRDVISSRCTNKDKLLQIFRENRDKLTVYYKNDDFLLEHKDEILNGNYKETAEKYGIVPTSIYNWRNRIKRILSQESNPVG